MMPVTGINILRLVMRFLLIAVLLEVVLMAVSYLREGKGLFGRRHSLFYSWPLTAGVGVIVSALFTVFYALYLPVPVSAGFVLRLAVMFVLGVGAVMLYLYSLVVKDDSLAGKDD